MIELYTPSGLRVKVPETKDEDNTPRFDVNVDTESAVSYYKNNGYVIFSACVSQESCDQLRNLWEKNIKSYKGTIYRQTTVKAEKNIFNDNGWVMNPILNLQSLNPKHFGDFRYAVDKDVFSNPSICKALRTISGEKPKIVQSMYFEGNSATWEHQDSYYLDSEKVGQMVAGWLALEEIKAEAGRFFICPESHKINLGKPIPDFDYQVGNETHDEYVSKVISTIKSKNMPVKAPCLLAGDILLWNSLTIHGSLNSQSKTHSRSSITMHAIPESHKFLTLRSHVIDIPTDDLGSSLIYRPRNMAKFKNRLKLILESFFPRIYYWVRKTRRL